jgi:hypothetical protein
MIIQPTSAIARSEYGEHVSRIVPVGSKTPEDVKEAAKALGATNIHVPGDAVAYVVLDRAEQKTWLEKRLAGEFVIDRIISSLRTWVATHSHIYYNLGKNVVSDAVWDRKAMDLVQLQKYHGVQAYVRRWESSAFEGFDGSTGMDLPVTEGIRKRVQAILN